MLYNNICQNSCPNGYININYICESCLFPCATCSSIKSNCTSCVTNQIPPIFLTTSNTCVTSSDCPAGTYGNTSYSQCAVCDP